MANKEEIPYPSKPKRGQKAVPVPLWMAPKVALYWAMKESGTSNVEFAKQFGVRETLIRRMLDPDHATKAEKIRSRSRRSENGFSSQSTMRREPNCCVINEVSFTS